MTFSCYTVKETCRTVKIQADFSWQTTLQHPTMVGHNKKRKKIDIGGEKISHVPYSNSKFNELGESLIYL